MSIEDILKELGSQMGLPNLHLDDNNVCRLVFDKRFTVDIEASPDKKSVHMYSALCELPPEGREELYEALLEANLFGRGTGGAAFGVDKEMNEILLNISFAAIEDVPLQTFINTLESFVNYVEAWTEKLDKRDYSRGFEATARGSAKEGSSQSRPDAPPPGGPMLRA